MPAKGLPAKGQGSSSHATLDIDARDLQFDDLSCVLSKQPMTLRLTRAGRKKLQASRQVIEQILTRKQVVYGVNTGFGKLSGERISGQHLERLQVNLIRSHACGVGELLSEETVRLCLLLRIRALAQGFSGVRPQLLERMIALFNAGISPCVPAQGSVGASGDLAPLAHMALALLGEGTVWVNGKKKSARAALKGAGIEPIKLAPKEGLALINGTQVTTALTAQALVRAEQAARVLDIACALSLDAYKGTVKALDPKIHQIRRQEGQKLVARNLRGLLRGSAIMRAHRECERVQDPYSFRCAPQVHGTFRDALKEARRVIALELNAVTDNPLVFAEQNQVISGGNFHAQPIAATADRLAAAVTDAASISERRIENLVNPDLSELPAFLTPDAGLCSGFMIPQVVAAALVSECKSFSFPAAVDSIPTSANKEDHVSMGPIAARKALKVVANLEYVLSIELLVACQALDFEQKDKSSRPLDGLYRFIRRSIPSVQADRSMSEEFERVASWIRSGEVLQVVAKQGGKVV